MATHVEFCRISNAGRPLVYGKGGSYENMSPTASSTQSTNSAGAGHNVVRIVANGESVYALAGGNPTASATAGVLVLTGTEIYLEVDQGDKVAIITA